MHNNKDGCDIQETSDKVDWIIAENVNSDGDNDSSSLQVNNEKVTLSNNRPKKAVKGGIKSSKVACFNILIANLRDKALSKHSDRESVGNKIKKNYQISSLDIFGNKSFNTEEKPQINSSSLLQTSASDATSKAAEHPACSSLMCRTTKDTENVQSKGQASNLTLRNLLMNGPSVVTNSYKLNPNSLNSEAYNFKSQDAFTEKIWLPQLSELIKSKSLTSNNGQTNYLHETLPTRIKENHDNIPSVIKDERSQHQRQPTLKTSSSLLTKKISSPEQQINESVKDEHFDCHECNKTFGTSASLNAHKRYHRLRKKLVCLTCKKEFSVSREFQQHLKQHNKPMEHVCSVCYKIFSVAGALKRHMLVHREQPTKENNEGNELKCPVCCEKFSKYYIKNHIKIHCGDRPYSCNKCTKAFTHKQSLEAHKLKHKREMLVWQCDLCDRFFDYEYLLKRHMKLHDGKYKCNKCDKTLKNKASFLSHWRTHNPTSYQCDVCNRTYLRYSAYFSHYQNHKNVQKNPLPEVNGNMLCELAEMDDSGK